MFLTKLYFGIKKAYKKNHDFKLLWPSSCY